MKIGNKEMKTIPLTQGMVALVDNADYEWLTQWRWLTNQGYHTFYAIRYIHIAEGKRIMIQMHRVILGLQPGDKRQCDHIDGDGVNNQMSNLRICTRMQNGQSRRKWKSGASRYKGVSWHCNRHKWCSQIRVNKKLIHLGLFDLEIDAARAYDTAAIKYHKDFVMTNKMLGLY